ncbi:uncharacterized protein RSE6_14176 [Rhynchosporium secalis]|uniref:Uncharacterized protein n=1 Tax=Rhynchosporium secalis TaxID=38038 RepID=A0A1E1MUN3_RHYSE|nr:uncharacterized protein RSE6_14176 [Rhynchosporium secalis]
MYFSGLGLHPALLHVLTASVVDITTTDVWTAHVHLRRLSGCIEDEDADVTATTPGSATVTASAGSRLRDVGDIVLVFQGEEKSRNASPKPAFKHLLRHVLPTIGASRAKLVPLAGTCGAGDMYRREPESEFTKNTF